MIRKKGITAVQAAIGWLLAQKPFIVPIPGTSNMERMRENVGAADVTFTDSELQEIRRLLDDIEIVGERYDPDGESARSVRR